MKTRILRREFLTTTGALVAAATWPRLVAAERNQPQVKTFVFKRVGDLEIKADVHRPNDDRVRPVVVWIHGGALIMGGRQGVNRRVREMLLGAGYAIVSIDYRLAPETHLPFIIEDIEDAFKWVRESGPELFNVDASRIAVMGGSAGGYLTLTSGFRVKPRPMALVSFWGYGDLIGPWYSQPSPHPRHHRVKISPKAAEGFLGQPPIANSSDHERNGGHFYSYCRQTGLWPRMVSGWDPHTEADAFAPYMPVKNVTFDYPPTLLIHGTDDTDVPHEQSVLMENEFKKHAVPYRFISVRNGEHGLPGADPKDIDRAYEAVLEFVNRYMKK